MATQQWLLVPLFEQFIKDSSKGKRLKVDGKKIKPQTIENYIYVLQSIKDFEKYSGLPVRIKAVGNQNKRLLTAERNYWKKFYTQFTDYLYKQKGCYDNYTGNVIKIIKVFFNHCKKENMLPVGEFHKGFYVTKEEILL